MKTRSKIRIPMPARYVINLALVVGFYFLLTGLISSGVITNYWTGILITVGINIILAVSLNIATGYLGQLPLGHAGFMAVGAYAGGIFMKATPAAALLKEGITRRSFRTSLPQSSSAPSSPVSSASSSAFRRFACAATIWRSSPSASARLSAWF